MSFQDRPEIVDINTADVNELVDALRLNREIAQRIVTYRKSHGPFESLEELHQVKGVTEEIVEMLRGQAFRAGQTPGDTGI